MRLTNLKNQKPKNPDTKRDKLNFQDTIRLLKGRKKFPI